MRKYFETEMHLLKQAMQKFAAEHPEQDPYVERLLEGVAYLTAQIHQKIDDDIPEISASLLQHLCPHLLRPFPAITIIQFAAQPGRLQQTHELAIGTMLQSQKSTENKQSCKFRTTTTVKLNPLQIAAINVIPNDIGTKITLDFSSEVELTQLDLSHLKIYLHADPALATELHYALTAHVEQIQILLPQQNINLATPQDILLPLTEHSFAGFHLLHEYFLCREKYLFISITDLEQITWPQQCQQFSLAIQLKHVFSAKIITKNMFQLHCTPALNLFNTTSEPIKLTHKQYEYPVIADVQDSQDPLIYSIDQVTGTDIVTGKQNIYHPFTSLKYKDNDNYYHLRQYNKHNYITLCNKSTNPENISCNITCCNGNYPHQHLQANQVNVPMPNFPSQIQFSNITRPTRMYMPPTHDNYRWSLISHLALNYRSLNDIETLHKLLQSYDWSQNKINLQHIAGIVAIVIEPINQIRQSVLTHGIKFNLTVNETNFASLADIHLFGLVLHHFFSMYANINTLVTTHVNCCPSNKEFIWEPISGTNYLV